MKPLVIALVSLMGAVAHAELRYAYVDVRRALDESDAGKAVKQKLQKEVERRQKELDALMAELQKSRTEFEKQRPMLTASAVDQKERDLSQRLSLLQDRALRMQGEIEHRQQQETAPIVKRLQGAVARVADREHFTLVLDRSSVILGPAALDITAEVIRTMNSSNL